MPKGKWQFDEDVAAVFENMLERSIVQYDVMRDLCFKVGQPFVQPGTDILDIGCSTGEALRPFVDLFGTENRFVMIDVSDPMLARSRAKFATEIEAGLVRIENIDLRRDFPGVRASLILSILSIQFTPIEYRLQILRRIYDSLQPGGAFVLVEKILGNTAEIDDLFVKSYYAIKSTNGYTQEQIERKRLSLEGVLVPVTAEWNEDLMRKSGFAKVDCFWRFLNFAGWIAVK